MFLAHGCVHSAHNYWPQSEECPECRGLPEELSHTLQALKLGYAGGPPLRAASASQRAPCTAGATAGGTDAAWPAPPCPASTGRRC